MELRESDNQVPVERGADANARGADFLQSAEWAETLKREGQTVQRVGEITLVKRRLFGSYFYWYAPRGFYGAEAAAQATFSELGKEAGSGKRSRALFLRFEPLGDPTNLAGGGRLIRTRDEQPRRTASLDLRKSEEELLTAMHPKTRYNIRLAEKKGVTVVGGGPKDAAEFWRLMSLTAGRDRFRLHGRKHYENLLAADPKFIKLLFARYQGQSIAAGLFAFYEGRTIYLHGASDNAYREAMAPHLLQWEAIRMARAAGGEIYDFYGLDEKKWPGVTRFKRGFGGQEIEYPGTFDLIYRPGAYRLYGWFRKLRRMV